MILIAHAECIYSDCHICCVSIILNVAILSAMASFQKFHFCHIKNYTEGLGAMSFGQLAHSSNT